MRKWMIDIIIFAALVSGAASYSTIEQKGTADALSSQSSEITAAPESAAVLSKLFESLGVSPHAALLQARVSLPEILPNGEIEKIAPEADVQCVPTQKGALLLATLCVQAQVDIIETARESLTNALAPYGPCTVTLTLTGVRPGGEYIALQEQALHDLCAIEKGSYETTGLSSRSLISPLLSGGQVQIATRQKGGDVLVYAGTPVIPIDY